MPEGVRRRQTGAETFWFNYGRCEARIAGQTIPAAGVLRQAT